MYWCLDLICRNIGTSLKHNKYIFDIPIPFCHNLYLSATFKQFLTEFAGTETVNHIVYMFTLFTYENPTCDLIGQFDQSDRTCGLTCKQYGRQFRYRQILLKTA